MAIQVQGQGKTTQRKECRLADILEQSLRLSRGALGFPYWHLDMNAGTGWNDAADCEGSPLVFAGEAISANRDTRAVFCDINEAATVALTKRMQSVIRPHWSVFCGDNTEALKRFATTICAVEQNSRYSFGSVVCDPNGWKGFPFGALSEFASVFPRIDLVFNLNASFANRVRGCRNNPSTPANRAIAEKYPPLRDILDTMCRRSWYVVSHKPNGPGERFLLMVGRSRDVGPPHDSFYSLCSPQGRELIDDIRHVQPNQPLLFPDLLD